MLAAVRGIRCRLVQLLMIGAMVVAVAAFPGLTRAGSRPVKVPQLSGAGVQAAYQRLHLEGLKVSLPAVELRFVVDAPVHVVGSAPEAGQRVPAGSVVSLTLGCPRCGAGSPGVPRHMPHYVVPNFLGRRLDAAYQWVRHKQLFYVFRLGRLTAGNARSLFADYRIVAQTPLAGRSLALGRKTKHAFTPTPLTVTAKQRTSGH